MLTVSFIFVVLLTFVTLLALPCNLIALPLLYRLARVRPEARSPLLLLLVAAPWLIGGGVLISSVVDVFFGACDVGNICLWNEDPHLVSSRRLLLVVPLLAGMGNIGLHLGRQLARSRRALRALARTAWHDADADALIVPSAVPLAFAGHGKVFVSQGLRAALAPGQLEVVLLHERAHLQRSDGLCQVVARALSCILLPPIRRRVLEALTLANEQSCDEIAGQAVGRLETAQVILAAERLFGGQSRGLSPAFAESFVPERVRHLMSPLPPAWRGTNIYTCVICGLLSIFMLGDLVYYVSLQLLYPSSLP